MKSAMKQKIVDAVVDITEASSMRSVHIAKIIKELGINRNTFYYHFDGKYDVAMYVFRHDLADELTANVPPDRLLEAPLSSEGISEMLPYYVHFETGARSLDLSDFFKSLVRCVMRRPSFYDKLFNNKEPEFKARMDTLYRPAVEDDFKFVLDGRYMPKETFDYLVSRYLDDISFIPSYHLANTAASAQLLDERINPFWNLPYEILPPELQKHPINRLRQ